MLHIYFRIKLILSSISTEARIQAKRIDKRQAPLDLDTASSSQIAVFSEDTPSSMSATAPVFDRSFNLEAHLGFKEDDYDEYMDQLDEPEAASSREELYIEPPEFPELANSERDDRSETVAEDYPENSDYYSE